MSCKEFATLCASEEFASAGWQRRLAIRFHFLICEPCRIYASQIRALGAGARRLWGPGPEDEAAVERVERKVLEDS